MDIFFIQMTNKNKVLIKLILQVLDEPREIFGYYGRFAKVFEQHTGIKFNRTKVQQWQTRIPKKFLSVLEELSKKHAKNSADVITAEELKTGVFKKSKSEYLLGLITINFAGITFTGNNLMFKLFLSAIATIKLTPTTINGVVKPVENVTYRSNDESILVVDEYGNVSAVGFGKATIHITADAQIGEGVTPLTESIEIEVTPEQAVALNPTLETYRIPTVDSGETSGVSDSDTTTETADETPAIEPLVIPDAPLSEATATDTVAEPTAEQPQEQEQAAA